MHELSSANLPVTVRLDFRGRLCTVSSKFQFQCRQQRHQQMSVRRGIYRHCASQMYRMRRRNVQVHPRYVGMHVVRTWQILHGRDGHVRCDVSELPRPFVFAVWLRTRHSVSVRRRLYRPRRRNVRAVRRRNIQDAARVDRVCAVRGGHAFCVGRRAHGLDVCGLRGGHVFCVGGRARALDVCGVRGGHLFCVGGR